VARPGSSPAPTRARALAQAFIGRSRNKRDRLEAAKELKALVFFSNIVVAALLEDVQARPPCRAPSRPRILQAVSDCLWWRSPLAGAGHKS